MKASGGIRSLADAITMLQAGASRIGASASVKIVAELAGHASANPQPCLTSRSQIQPPVAYKCE